MSDLNVNILAVLAVVLFCFLINAAFRCFNAWKRNIALEGLIKHLETMLPKPISEDEKEKGETYAESILEEYKRNQRIQLKINNEIVQDVSLKEHEDLAHAAGVQTDGVLIFNLQLGGEPPEGFTGQVVDFPKE